MSENCICGNNKTFDQCCGRFLSGEQHPKTPEQLMRSRYSAYALGGYGQYLLQTWFPATAQGLTVQQLSERKLDWQKLEVLNKSQKGDTGEVEFKAYFFKDSLDKEKEKLEVLHEKSEFKRLNGQWLYVGAIVDKPS